MRWIRILLGTIGFGGALLFGAAFVASYARPAFVERAAEKIIRAEVERRVRARVAEVEGSALGSIAAAAARGNEAEIERVRRLLADSLRARVAAVSAEMQDPECACRNLGAAMGSETSGWSGVLLSQAQTRLTALIRARYLDVAAKLTREFRIFTAANALVLLFLGIAVVVRRNARLHLLPAAALLVCSAGVVGWFYLFRQDWLHTIVFSDYGGLAYFAWLAAPVLLIGDVVLNRGRVSAQLLNAGSGVVGSTVSVLPC